MHDYGRRPIAVSHISDPDDLQQKPKISVLIIICIMHVILQDILFAFKEFSIRYHGTVISLNVYFDKIKISSYNTEKLSIVSEY